MVMEAHGNLAI